jgi:hypothetical protein
MPRGVTVISSAARNAATAMISSPTNARSARVLLRVAVVVAACGAAVAVGACGAGDGRTAAVIWS